MDAHRPKYSHWNGYSDDARHSPATSRQVNGDTESVVPRPIDFDTATDFLRNGVEITSSVLLDDDSDEGEEEAGTDEKGEGREEGEERARDVRLTPSPIASDELPEGLAPAAEGWLRTDPGMLSDQGGMDGFFIARWRAPAR